MSRSVALVAPHFPPSNLAGVHRARLLAQHLAEFGWRPIIITTHWRYYEDALDWDLASMVDPDLEVIRTAAFPTKPLRLVGDIGIRALPWHLRTLRKLWKDKRIDFVHITVPSFYSALLGELLNREHRFPFGIDYIDPWVHVWPGAEKRFSKAWISMKLGDSLEPWAVRNASLITGVAAGYYQGVFERNPHLKQVCVSKAMPYGNSAQDFNAALALNKPLFVFDPRDGNYHFVYAGAMLPKAYSVLELIMKALSILKDKSNSIYGKLRWHFIGTGKTPIDPKGFNVLPTARRFGIDDIVQEHPHRLPYADTLTHLANASAILIIGSTEAHYTPSKVFQAVQAKRPVFALLHEKSTAVSILRSSRAGVTVTLSEQALPNPDWLAVELENFVDQFAYDERQIDWTSFDNFSARASACTLASALDEAVDKFGCRFAGG